MPSESEVRRGRCERLGKAIEAYCQEMGFEHLLGDWIVIGSLVRVDEDGDPNCEYFIAMSGGSMLQHHALGLLAKADEMFSDSSLEG